MNNSISNIIMEKFILEDSKLSESLKLEKPNYTILKKMKKIKLESLSSIFNIDKKYELFSID